MNPFSAVAAKIYAGLLGAAISLVVVQTVRIEGLWFITGLEQKLTTAREDLAKEKIGRANDRAEWVRQVNAAAAARVAAERKSQEIASHAQSKRDALAADSAGLRDYIADHRLRDGPGTSTGTATGTVADRGARVSPSAATGTFVATSEGDLVTCDADYVYAAGAYEFVQELISSGLGK